MFFYPFFQRFCAKVEQINYRLEEEEEFMQNVMYNSYQLYCAISSVFIDYGSCRRAYIKNDNNNQFTPVITIFTWSVTHS